MRTRSRRCASLLILALAASGCSGNGNVDPDLGTLDMGTGVNPDMGEPDNAPEFLCQVVDGVGSSAIVGDNAALALTADGMPAIAYGVVPAGSSDREVHYAEQAPDGTWSSELIVLPGAMAPGGGELTGLGLAFVGGQAHVVYQGGDDDGVPTTPFPTDLMLSVRQGGSWTERTLVDTSAEAPATCDGVQNYCNTGGVVGTHASIKAGPNGGFAVVYRDTHFGFAKDDFARSDVEVYAEGGPFTNSNVDPVRSGGTFAEIAYTPEGALVVAYNLDKPIAGEERTGVWAAYYDGAEWQLRRVMESVTTAKVSLEAAPDGTLYLAMYHANNSDLVVASSSDGGDTWTTETVDSRGKTGLHPHLSFDGQGRPVVAYTYCGPQSDTSCPGQLGQRSEVRMARLESSGWSTYTVDDGQGNGFVGLFNRIVSLPDGKLGVAFQDARNNDLLFAKEQ